MMPDMARRLAATPAGARFSSCSSCTRKARSIVQRQQLGLERLGAEVVRAEADGLQRVGAVVLSGEHDDLGVGRERVDLLEQLRPSVGSSGCGGKPEVHRDDCRLDSDAAARSPTRGRWRRSVSYLSNAHCICFCSAGSSSTISSGLRASVMRLLLDAPTGVPLAASLRAAARTRTRVPTPGLLSIAISPADARHVLRRFRRRRCPCPADLVVSNGLNSRSRMNSGRHSHARVRDIDDREAVVPTQRAPDAPSLGASHRARSARRWPMTCSRRSSCPTRAERRVASVAARSPTRAPTLARTTRRTSASSST